MPEISAMDFAQITAIEPRLKALYEQAVCYPVTPGYCPVTVWYRLFKVQLVKLVGLSSIKLRDTVFRGIRHGLSRDT